MRIDAPIITGSFSLNGDTFNDLGAYTTTGSNTFIGDQSIVGAVSASALTGSISYTNLTGVPTLVSGSDQVVSILSSLNSYTQSNDTTNTTQNSRLTSLEQKTGSLASTGSNTFYGTQIISGTTWIAGDFIVQGSSSIQYISASSVSIGTNIVNLNTATPAVRYAGISVQDSGSENGVTGSILWDSVCNKWIYSNPSGVGYSGGMILSGPRTQTLGSESPLTCNYIAKSGGGDHLYDSCIWEMSGSMGINTASPAVALHVDASGGGIIRATRLGTGAGYIQLEADGTNGTLTSSNGLLINTGGTQRANITSTGIVCFACTICTPQIYSQQNSDSEFQFLTLNNQSCQGTASAARFDLGTHVNQYALTFVRYGLCTTGTRFGDNIANTTQIFDNAVSSCGMYVGLATGTGNLNLITGGSKRLIITSGGLVSINQTSAYGAFNVTGIDCGWGEGIIMNPAPNGYNAINFRLEGRTGSCVTCTWQLGKEASLSNAGGEVFELNKQGLTGGAGYRADAVQQWKTNGDSIFGFNVGIKNTSPQGALHIGGALASSGDAAAINLKQTGTNETTGIYLERSGERKGYAIYVGGSVDSLVFQRNNAGTKSDVLTLTRDGNIGIGVVPSSWPNGVTALQIGTTGALWNRASDGLVVLASNSYYDGSVDKQITTNTSNRIYFVNGSTYFERASSTAAGSNTPWNTSMVITNSGDVYIGGSTSLASGALIVGDNSSTRPIVSRTSGGVDGTYSLGMAFYPWNTSESNAILTTVSSAAGISGFRFDVSNGGGTTGRTASLYVNRSSVSVVGSLSKGSGSFRICHPLSSKVKTHALVHSFIEGPNADLIYSGHTKLTNGIACVNIDCASRMTEGTFEALNRCVRIFTTNETSWDAVRGKVLGNIVVIESQNNNSEDEISWMVIGERKDQHMFDTDWTDSCGRVITEPEILHNNICFT